MILNGIFGDTTRVKILQKFISKWGLFLNANEISRMSNVSKRATYSNIKKLDEIGLLEKKEGKSTKYRLKKDDKRNLILAILEGEEYLHKNKNFTSNNWMDELVYIDDNEEDVNKIQVKIPVEIARNLGKTLLKEVKDHEKIIDKY